MHMIKYWLGKLALFFAASSAAVMAQSAEFEVVDSAVYKDLEYGGWDWNYRVIRCSDRYNCVALVLNAVKGRAAIRATEDGASTWSSKLVVHQGGAAGNGWDVDGVRLFDVAMATSDIWIAVGDSVFGRYDYGTNPPTRVTRSRRFIVRTTNAGESWVTDYVSDSGPTFTGATMFGGRHGVVTSHRELLYTTNAGENWTAVTYPPIPYPEPSARFRTVIMLSPTHWRTTAYSRSTGLNYLVNTYDAGQTWAIDSSNDFDQIERHDFIDSAHGWRVGWIEGANPTTASGYVMRTTDGGGTWSQQWSREERRPTGLLSVDFINPYVGFAAGLDAEFMYTVDGGISWTRYDTLVRYDIKALGESPTILSVVGLDENTALLGLSTTKLIRFTRRVSHVGVDPRDPGNGVLIYPNPSGAVLGARLSRYSKEVRFQIVNNIGQIVLHGSRQVATDRELNIDVSSLNPGSFTMVIDTEHGRLASRFIRR